MIALISCSKDDAVKIHDIGSAQKVSVDRFSSTAGHLQVRTATNGLPAANAPVNFDQGPFITKGLGTQGQHVEYYNFDLQPTTPAPIYVLFKEGESSPVSGQLNIIDVLPGEMGYISGQSRCVNGGTRVETAERSYAVRNVCAGPARYGRVQGDHPLGRRRSWPVAGGRNRPGISTGQGRPVRS